MKELWTANPFCLMNRPFAEMGYNSSGLNIAPKRLLLATRRPFTRHPLASGAPSFDPLRHPPTRHKPSATHGTTSGDPRKPSAVVLRSTWRPPAQHPPSRRKPSAISLRAILSPAPHPSALCKPSARQLTARCPPAHRKPSVIARRSIRHLAASHPPSRCAPSFDPRASSAGTLQAICRHEPMPLTARRTNRRRKQEP